MRVDFKSMEEEMDQLAGTVFVLDWIGDCLNNSLCHNVRQVIYFGYKAS